MPELDPFDPGGYGPQFGEIASIVLATLTWLVLFLVLTSFLESCGILP